MVLVHDHPLSCRAILSHISDAATQTVVACTSSGVSDARKTS